MTTLETDRLVIRNFQGSDWEALHEMIVQYESSEGAAYDQEWPTAPEEIRKIATWFASGESYLAVCLRSTGRFIGFVSLSPEKDAPEVFNLGYIFNVDYHGKGYATEACRAFIAHTFGQMGAQRITTGTAAANGASCRLLERLGFRKTGETETSFRNGPDGKPILFLGFSYTLTREAWAVASTHGAG